MDHDDTLDRWLAREAELRQALESAKASGTEQAPRRFDIDGLAFMQAMLRGELPQARMARTLDFMLVEIDRGTAVFQGTPGASHNNPMGNIHGGWYATLLDSAMGCAVASLLPAGRGYTTAELSVNIVKAIGPKAPRVRAEARALHVGRQLATAEGRLVGPDGTLYAHGTTTCLVFEARPH